MRARPLRRVIASLAVRLGISPHEVKKLDLEEIRELMVVLTEKPKGASKAGAVTTLSDNQTQQQIEAALAAGFGKFV